MRRKAVVFVGGVLLALSGLAAAAFASGDNPLVALQTMTVTTSTSATTSTSTSTTPAPPKVTICHRTHSKKHPFHTIRISIRAWPAHMRHGDTMGACPSAATTTSSTTTTTSTHGHGRGHR
jgi:hypothetical protein